MPAPPLDEHRPRGGDEQPQHRPASDLGFRDECRRGHRVDREDVEPGDVVGDDQPAAGARSECRIGLDRDAAAAHQGMRPDPDRAAPGRRSGQREQDRLDRESEEQQ
jgi:hypothetical protein